MPPEMENCETCHEHSGVQQRVKNLSWMMGILIALIIGMGGAQIRMLMDVKEATAGHGFKFDAAAASDKVLCEKVAALERRVDIIESREKR